MSNLSDLAAIIAEEDRELQAAATASREEYMARVLLDNLDHPASFAEVWLAAFRAGADWEQRREIEEPT